MTTGEPTEFAGPRINDGTVELPPSVPLRRGDGNLPFLRVAAISQDLGQLALSAARAGAAAIRAVTGAGQLGTQFKSGGHDMVTAADKASERAVIDVIRAARPDDSILGEEGGSHQGTSDVRWLIDPLDGTANFVYGRADFAVSVGVELAGEPTAGAIFSPADGQWVMSGRDGVASGRDGLLRAHRKDAIPAVRHGELSDALVAFGLPYSLPARRQVLSIAAALVPRLRGVRVMGSAASDLAAVALGQCDAFIGFGLAEWDVAAGRAIVLAAGGAVCTTHQSGLEAMIAGCPSVVDELAGLIGRGAGPYTAKAVRKQSSAAGELPDAKASIPTTPS